MCLPFLFMFPLYLFLFIFKSVALKLSILHNFNHFFINLNFMTCIVKEWDLSSKWKDKFPLDSSWYKKGWWLVKKSETSNLENLYCVTMFPPPPSHLESSPFYIPVVFTLPYLQIRKLFFGHRNVATYWFRTWPPSEPFFFRCLFGCYKLHLLCSINLFRSVSFLKVHKLVSWYRIMKSMLVFC